MKKIQSFQITGMTIAGFKSYGEPTELVFGNPTVITGGNGRGKTSIADAIAFAVTGLPFFGERGIDRLPAIFWTAPMKRLPAALPKNVSLRRRKRKSS